ncbi:MAG: PBP1A family penicillin-binding protein, partial [Alphaproteobacteria bacterium]|nr:PBP1A family penicillin-binding protein [Alphaproteobacteria bacterium]
MDASDRIGAEPARHQRQDEPEAASQPSSSRRKSASTQERAPHERGSKHGRSKGRTGRSLLGHLLYWSVVLGVWGVIGLTGLIVYHAGQLPPIDQLAIPKRPPNIAILGTDGTLMANRGDTGGPAIQLRELPAYLPKAFVAIEDRRFYSHAGIDPIGIARAAARNLTGRGGVQGGSTLTQQLAKNLFLTQERTFSRKIQEAILSLWLEHKFSKDQILELYLNRVYFGAGAYGVEAAARKYFGHGAKETTLSQAAVLAGLMKAPTKLAPNRNPKGAIERAAQVITAMQQEGFITEAMAKIALAQPAEVYRDTGAGSINYVADYVMDVLADTIGAIDQDLIVSTTIDPAMQASAEKALAEELDKQGPKFAVSQGALISIDVNGQIKALVGGKSYAESQFNRAVAAKRQPGSSFKPFVYLTALEHGLTPDTIREDAPINIKGWQPENSTHQYSGAVTLTKALALSLNTVAVRLGLEVGAKNIAATAHRLGINSDLQINASIALGTSEVTPLELTGAYVAFANGGIGVQPHIIDKVRSGTGEILYLRKGASNGRIIEPQYVAMMNTMMQETLLTGTARKAEVKGWQAAGKTGTSQDYRDAWFVGYTSQLVTGVWLGNDDATSTKRVSGGNLPVDIWTRFMREAHRNLPAQPLPLSNMNWRTLTPAPMSAPNTNPLSAPAAPMAAGAPLDVLP